MGDIIVTAGLNQLQTTGLPVVVLRDKSLVYLYTYIGFSCSSLVQDILAAVGMTVSQA